MPPTMSEEHYRAQQTLLVRGNDLARLQADLKTFSKRQGSFTLDEDEHVRATRLPRFVIHPLDTSYQWWSDFLLLWVMYTAWVGPFEFAFIPRAEGVGLTISDSISDFFFICDLIITFFVAYYSKETAELIVNRNRIACRYLRTFFILDLLSCIPFRTVLRGTTHGSATHLLFRILGLLRLWRLRRLSRLFSKLEKNIRINYFWTRMVKFVLVIILAGHFAGCFFYFLATTYPTASQGYTWIGQDTDDFRAFDLYRRYITSLYFAIVTLTTVGYGDYSPHSVREITFAIFYIIFSMGLTAYVIGNITALIQKSSARTLQYRVELKDLHTYCVYNNLPSSLRAEMVDFMQLKFRISEKRRDVMERFPRPIRARVAKLLHRETLEGADLFQGCSSEVIEQIEADVEVEYYMPNDILIAQKDIHPQLHILTAGMVELSITEGGSQRMIGIWRPHQSVGDVALLCGIPQPFTCKAIQLCRVLTVKREVFQEVLRSFPQDAQQMANNLLKTIRTEGDTHLDMLADQVARIVAKKEEELVVQLCAAAAHGDLRQLRQLMQSGIDPNAGDFDGRRPLHVAAAMGYDDCVRFLVSNGADVNVKDKFSCTPLSEAIRMVQYSTAELLREHGADITPRVASYDLCSAVAGERARHVAMLLHFGANPNSVDYDGRTPLQIATSLGNGDLAQLLIRHGGNPEFSLPSLQTRHGNEYTSSLDDLEKLRNVDGPPPLVLSHVDSLRHIVDRSEEAYPTQAELYRVNPAQPPGQSNQVQSNPVQATPIRTNPAEVSPRDNTVTELSFKGAARRSDAQNAQKATGSNLDLNPGVKPNPQLESSSESDTNIDIEDHLRSHAPQETSTDLPDTPLVHTTPLRLSQTAFNRLGLSVPNASDLSGTSQSSRQHPSRLDLDGLSSNRSSPSVIPTRTPNRTPPIPSPPHRTPFSSPQLSLRADSDVPNRYRDKAGAVTPSDVLPLLQAVHRARSEAQESAPSRGSEPKRIKVHPVEEPGGRLGSGGLVVALKTTMSELLRLADTEFGYVATRLFDSSGAEIRDVRLLRDGDHVFLAGAAAAPPLQRTRTGGIERRLSDLQGMLAALQAEMRGSKS